LYTLLRHTGILACGLLFAFAAAASEGLLGDNQRIYSSQLGYQLQYRIYRPAGITAASELPTLYVTDGQMYLANGNFKAILDEAIGSGMIEPLVVVFIDSRNPDKLDENRRTSEFMCNAKYAGFFANELIPTISREQPVSPSRGKRVILGVSFGGLNAACFGLALSELFSGIAMQSPASGKHLDVVRELYEEREPLPLKVFISVGSRNDNTGAVKRFDKTLENKGYDVTFVKVRGTHDWKNWTPLIDDVLLTFFAVDG